MGGKSKKIILYYNKEFKHIKCGLGKELGGCKLTRQIPNMRIFKCITCGKYIHEACDTLTGIKIKDRYKCPKCRKNK